MKLGSQNMKLARLFELTSNHESAATVSFLRTQPIYALLVLSDRQPGSAGHSLV